jgi:DNA-binding CsgD family transcriptional regulator
MGHSNLISVNPKTSQSRSVGRTILERRDGTGGALTPRELEIEDLLCRGYSQENIAAILDRSIHTISVHVLSLYRKRGVHSQVGLLLTYLERKGIFVFPAEGNNCVCGQGRPSD